MILATNNKVAVHFQTLIPEFSFQQISDIFARKNYQIEKKDIVELAKTRLGQPYKRGSKNEDNFDCSSFTKWVYAQIGIWIPRISIDQRSFGQPVEVSDLKKGDLLFCSGRIDYFWDKKEEGVGHVGLFTGESVIHAANKRRGVVEDDASYFLNDEFRGAVRIHPKLEELRTVNTPSEMKIEYDTHLRWKVLQTIK